MLTLLQLRLTLVDIMSSDEDDGSIFEDDSSDQNSHCSMRSVGPRFLQHDIRKSGLYAEDARRTKDDVDISKLDVEEILKKLRAMQNLDDNGVRT